jgi:anti-anti-sigma regulatory factor
MKHTLTIKKTESGNDGFLALTGHITIMESLEIKKILMTAIDQVNTLMVDFSGIDSADVSFIQIICAAHQEAFLSEKKIHLSGPLPDTIRDLLKNSGYSKQTGCLHKARGACMWS